MKQNIFLKNFIDMDVEEKKMVLEWRNHPGIKKWMYTTDEISLNDHLEFIEGLKNRNDKMYFLVIKDNEHLGVVDFYNIDANNKSCEFGLYADPNSKVPGVGRILEEVSIDYVFNTLKLDVLKLEVFSENVQVRNLHKKYKFKETERKLINQKEVVCMELKNEDR